jgi:hypothetical protein
MAPEGASSKEWTVYRLQRQTARHMPQAVVILLWRSRSLLLSHRSGLAGDGKDRLATGKAVLVRHTNVGG